jgi:ABC-type Zn2+ transport system substrate-binding protein/surface adhesin
MRSPAHLSLTLLAFTAMLWAQVFGLHRGFVCDCGGVAEVTQIDHCHGPHSEACHDHEEEFSVHHHDDHEDSDHESEGTHEHAALVERLVAGAVSDMDVQAPRPLVSAFEMPVWAAEEVVSAPARFADRPRSWIPVPRRRSWPEVWPIMWP